MKGQINKQKSLVYKSFRNSDGAVFVEFHWEEKPLEGEGMCTYQDGSAYSGFFKSGCFHGKGTFIWSDGSRYEGQWDNDLPHLRGTILLSDGYRYEGEWQNGVAEGKGNGDAARRRKIYGAVEKWHEERIRGNDIPGR